MLSFLADLLFDNVTYISLISVFAAIYYYSTSTYDKWRKLNIPYVPPVPLFGNAFKMLTRLEHPIDMFERMYYLFPDAKLFGYYQMRNSMLMVRDPELINTILVKDFSYFTDHGIDLDPSMSVLASSLFFSNGQRWRTMRQKLSPGFTSGKLKDTYCQINECSDEMVSGIVETLEKTDRLDVKTMTGGFSTDVIGTCAFGLKLDAIKNDDSKFRRYTKMIFQSTPKQLIIQMLMMTCPRVMKLFKIKMFSEEATKFFYDVFTDVIKYREEHDVVRNDLTQTLMEARKELVLKENSTVEDKFTDDDIIANAILMFTAGSETVSSMLSFCLYELALNKEIQDKLRAEIWSAKAKHDGQLNNDYLMDLHYTNMVLEETARKYSIAFSVMRVATKTYALPDESFVIEKGQKIIIPMFSIHRDPKYYPDPMKFDPERFSTEQKSQRPNGTYLPFGDGPRLCIGKRFAESEMKLALSNVLSKFEVLPCEQTEIPVDIRSGSGFITPKNGIVLKFRPIIEH
ncbi:cytochrome P450 6k1-like [Rhopalosiphum maidis]|uniref:cytochrome P450 6k1-like n=1 Tax=Rhopalosiphum maidis TaxID=43146 RepID=UPI000EFECB6C|nr:cytochrome P450 6k1-like [Rhopalosiphum maidis]